jgi:NosR/NirI family transcriptional regulator, nitrous oxide reductase regulator
MIGSMLRGIRRILPRLYRLAVVLAVAFLMHQRHQWLRAQRDTALTVEQARSLFPTAAKLGPRTPPHNIQTVQDADGRPFGLLFLTLGGLVMSFTKLRGQAHLRVAWQILLVLYLGLLTGGLLSMALFSGWAQNGVAWLPALGILVMAAAAFLIPWSTGHQLYCHHLCPHGALQQWMQKIPLPNLTVPPKLHRLLSAVPFVLLAFVLGNVMLGLRVNNAALEAFDAYLFRVAGWSSITIAVVGLLASAVVPLAYCKYGCPAGLLLKFLRSRGANDRLGLRDLLAGGLLLLVPSLLH